MYTTGKNAEELQEMIDRRERRIQKQDDTYANEEDRKEIIELQAIRDELMRFTPGTLILDPETGIAYRRRPFEGYSSFTLEGAVGMVDSAPENVTVLWTPEQNEG